MKRFLNPASVPGPKGPGLNPAQIRHVTALFLGRIGDLIVSTAFLRSLRERFPSARLRLVLSSRQREAARLLPFHDETLFAHPAHRLGQNLRLTVALLGAPCDLLVDLNPSFSRLSTAIAAVVRSPVKLAFEKGRLDRVFTHRAARAGEDEHMLDRYARLAAEIEAPYRPVPEVRVSPEDEARAASLLSAADLLDDGRLRMIVHPGNFKKFDNRWPEEKFAALTDLLLEDPSLRLAYMAGPGEEERVRAILARLKAPVPLLPPAPLGTVAAALKSMDCAVLNVTGTTHLAAAVGTPTFCLYAGYTDCVWRPRGERHAGVVSTSWESCRDIPVETAHAALKEHLARLRRPTSL